MLNIKILPMKIVAKIICLLIILASGSAIAQKVKTAQKAVIQTSIACDHCRECPTCGGLLEKTLIKTKGIQMITLDQDKKTITVIYNSKKTDLQAIKTAITKLGYDADELKADPNSYANLDGCCKA
jgi:mercuric ion binding protein